MYTSAYLHQKEKFPAACHYEIFPVCGNQSFLCSFSVFLFFCSRNPALALQYLGRGGRTRHCRLSVLIYPSSMPSSAPPSTVITEPCSPSLIPARSFHSLPAMTKTGQANTHNFLMPMSARVPSARDARKEMHLDIRSGDALVGFTQALVTADFRVLPLTLLHECLELGIVRLGDGLGLHLDVELSACALDACSDVDDGLLEQCDTHALVQALAGEDVQRWGHQLDLDLVVGCVARLGAPAMRGLVLVSNSQEEGGQGRGGGW